MFNNLIRTRSNNKSRRNKPRSSASGSSISYETLEPRRVLAGIFFDAAASTVTISGDGADDVGRFELLNPTTHRATLRGFGTMDFAVGSVDEVIFIGFNGDDFFANVTGVNSRLFGGNGADTLRGGSGDDTIIGGQGNNLLVGNAGEDRLVGNTGNDDIFGGAGADRIFAGDGANFVEGGDGDDLIFGGAGVDRINGQGGIDSIFALGGDDILRSGDGGVAGSTGVDQADLILGHAGNDRFIGGAGLNVFYGGDGDDIFTGGSGENRFHGQGGDDELTGGAGADFLAGNLGNDTIFGVGGNDFILPGQGNDIVGGGAGNDFIRVVGGDDVIDGGIGNDSAEYRFNLNTYSISGPGSNLTLNRVVDGTDTVNNIETLRFSDTNVSTIQQASQTNSNIGFFDSVGGFSAGTRDVVFAAADFGDAGTIVRDVNVSISFAKSNDEAFVPESSAVTPGIPFHNEIEFVLVSPAGTAFTLISNDFGTELVTADSLETFGIGSDGFQGTIVFDQSAAIAVDNTPQAPTAGTVRPDDDTAGSLNDFNGESAVGTWTLFIEDDVGLDGLSFYEFSVVIATDSQFVT